MRQRIEKINELRTRKDLSPERTHALDVMSWQALTELRPIKATFVAYTFTYTGVPMPDIERKKRLKNAGGAVAVAVAQLEGLVEAEMRWVVLGHLQRGGSPVPFDRVLATRFGVGAADLVHQGRWGEMVRLRNNHIEGVPIEQAIENNAKGGRIRGGSTISQQTAKNVFLWQGGGFVRKGFEAWFTFLIEHLWGKRRIMEVYLNVAETGIGTYGAEAGAQRYFNHSAARLSKTEAARMAAALPLPKERSVTNPRGWTRRYGNLISARMGVVRRDGLDSCVYD